MNKKIYKGRERQKEMLMYGIMPTKEERCTVTERHNRYSDLCQRLRITKHSLRIGLGP
jgi:hypothetical protein